MPKYCYFCENCDEYFDLVHSYKEKITKCTLCESNNTVSKFLGKPINLSKKTTTKSAPVGNVVIVTIEEIKEEIKNERKILKARKK